MFEIHASSLNQVGPMLHLSQHRADILAEYANGGKLDGRKKEGADHKRRTPTENRLQYRSL